MNPGCVTTDSLFDPSPPYLILLTMASAASAVVSLIETIVSKMWGFICETNFADTQLTTHRKRLQELSSSIEHLVPESSIEICQSSRHSLLHAFLLMKLGNLRLVIDPSFRTTLRVGLHDPQFNVYMETKVPEVFVGTRGQLKTTLERIVQESRAAFARAGTKMPPWREGCAVKSTWNLDTRRLNESEPTRRVAVSVVTPLVVVRGFEVA